MQINEWQRENNKFTAMVKNTLLQLQLQLQPHPTATSNTHPGSQFIWDSEEEEADTPHSESIYHSEIAVATADSGHSKESQSTPLPLSDAKHHSSNQAGPGPGDILMFVDKANMGHLVPHTNGYEDASKEHNITVFYPEPKQFEVDLVFELAQRLEKAKDPNHFVQVIVVTRRKLTAAWKKVEGIARADMRTASSASGIDSAVKTCQQYLK
jgi:hypothetical protein